MYSTILATPSFMLEVLPGTAARWTRVEVRSQGDELDTLARTFNTMVDRIQALVIGMREMTDNLAHDLRSPLGRIRASAETSLTSGPRRHHRR
ncbi:MAG: HAMP domain-containing protein [Gammaproteobacteria bacterium]